MTTYAYRCPHHDEEQTVFAPMGQAPATAPCPTCQAPMRRVWTMPTTGLRTFGKNMGSVRRPIWQVGYKGLKSEGDFEKARDESRAAGAVVQFGAGRTTGS